MNISLTGNLGSGKTSVCNELKEMGYEIVSTGTIFREIAKEKGVTLIELNEMAKTDRSIDDMIDARSIELGKTLDGVVFDSRLAWKFIPDSFKVFLLVDTYEAARRVFDGESRNAEEYTDIEDAKNGLSKRAGLERDRFKELYDIDYYDASNYNLVIESTNASPREIAEEIIRYFELFKKDAFDTKIVLNSLEIEGIAKEETFDKEEFQNLINKETNAQGLSSTEAVNIAMEDGVIYCLDNDISIAAAIKAGKKFYEVKMLSQERGDLEIAKRKCTGEPKKKNYFIEL